MQQGFTPKRSGARQGCLHKITLCIRRFGLFFSGTSGTVEVVGVQRLFTLRAGKALSHRRHEDGFVPYVRLDGKKCDRKKQQKGNCRGNQNLLSLISDIQHLNLEEDKRRAE